MRFLLDTTAFSAAMSRDKTLLNLLEQHQPGDIVTAPPVVAEIQYGLERLDKASRKHSILSRERDRWLSVIAVLPWSSEASQRFGEFKANLERRGLLIDDFDIAIASIAVANGCAVITANLNHFRRIDSLESKSWK